MIICFDFLDKNLRKQPWHSAKGIAEGLNHHHIETVIISDASSLDTHKPDAVIIVAGAHELLFPKRFHLNYPVYLLICNQRFTFKELARIPRKDWLREFKLLRLPLINSLIPPLLLKRGFKQSKVKGLLYLSDDANKRYTALGLPEGAVIKPRVEAAFRARTEHDNNDNDCKNLCYFGAPIAARGVEMVISAFTNLRLSGIDAKLNLLIRVDDDYTRLRNQELKALVDANPYRADINYCDEYLSFEKLGKECAKADIFLLPFRITISDVPLVIIEAALSGKPVITLDTPGVTDVSRELPAVYAVSEDRFEQTLINVIGKRPVRYLPDSKRWFEWQHAVISLIAALQRTTDLSALRFIALSGVDGSGKSTLCKSLQQLLAIKHIPHVYVWSRFRNYISKPFLLLMRLTGHNHKEVINGVRIGFHDFQNNAFIAYSFLCLQWIDTVGDIIFRYYIMRRGTLIIADRSVLDTLVDLTIDTGRKKFIGGWYGKSLLALLPKPRIIVNIKRDVNQIYAARTDVKSDPNFRTRIELYDYFCKKFGITTIDNNEGIEECLSRII